MIDDSQKPTRHVRETSSYGDLEQDANLLRSAQQRGISEDVALRQLKMRQDPELTSEVQKKFKAKPQHDPEKYLPDLEEEEFAFDESGPTRTGLDTPAKLARFREEEAARLEKQDEQYVAGLPPHKQQSGRAARRAARKGGVTLEQPDYYDPTLPEAADEPAAEAAVETPAHMAEWQVKDGTTYYRPEGDPYRYSKDADGTYRAIEIGTNDVVMEAAKDSPHYANFEAHFAGKETKYTRGKAAPPAPDEAAAEEGAELTDQILDEVSYDDEPGFSEDPGEAPAAPSPAAPSPEGRAFSVEGYDEAISPKYQKYDAPLMAALAGRGADVGGARTMARMLYDASEQEGGLTEADLRAHVEANYPAAQQDQAFQMLKRTAIDVDELKDLSARGEFRTPEENRRLMDMQMYYMQRGGGAEGPSRQYVLPGGRAPGADLGPLDVYSSLTRSSVSPIATRAAREAFRPPTRGQQEMLLRGSEGAEGQEPAPAPAPAPVEPPVEVPQEVPQESPVESPVESPAPGLSAEEQGKLAMAKRMMSEEDKALLQSAKGFYASDFTRESAIGEVHGRLSQRYPGATREEAILLLEHG